jgi:hypothetical protein
MMSDAGDAMSGSDAPVDSSTDAPGSDSAAD